MGLVGNWYKILSHTRKELWESNLRFLFAVFYPNLHIIFNFALDQATASLRRLICLAFRRFGFKPV